jgi:hypothetical protein
LNEESVSRLSLSVSPGPPPIPQKIVGSRKKDGEGQGEAESSSFRRDVSEEVLVVDEENCQVHDSPGKSHDTELDESVTEDGTDYGNLQ